jgi:hypothetical protein
VIQFGLPPRRLDLLTRLSGLEFDAAWSLRELHPVAGLEVPFLGRAELIANKRASGRPPGNRRGLRLLPPHLEGWSTWRRRILHTPARVPRA